MQRARGCAEGCRRASNATAKIEDSSGAICRDQEFPAAASAQAANLHESSDAVCSRPRCSDMGTPRNHHYITQEPGARVTPFYDVDAFEQALHGRSLKTDTQSRSYRRVFTRAPGSGVDVMVYEEYPYRYSADVSRRHRWIRGDWQLARWLLPEIPGPDRLLRKNPLSLLSRWKLFDNLRRSLVPSALTLLLLMAGQSCHLRGSGRFR